MIIFFSNCKTTDQFSFTSIPITSFEFNNSFIYKPYYSKPTSSQKYLICTHFDKKFYDTIKNKITKMLLLIGKNDKFIIDILSDIYIPSSFCKVLNFINIKIGGEQHKYKNKIIKYIKSEDYFGNEYQDCLDKQLYGVEYITSKFFPINKQDLIEIKKEFSTLIDKINNQMI